MNFNSSARFNRKSFNSEKLFDAGIHDAGTVTDHVAPFIDTVKNPGFETGDFTYWDEMSWYEPGETYYSEVSAAEHHTGSYSMKLHTDASTEGPPLWIARKQDIRLTDVTYINFWYKLPTATPPEGKEVHLWVGVDDGIGITLVWWQTVQVTDWTYVSVDISGYGFTGACLLYIALDEDSPW